MHFPCRPVNFTQALTNGTLTQGALLRLPLGWLYRTVCQTRNGTYLVDGILDVVGTAGRNEGMERLVLRWQRSTIFVPDFAFLHRPLPTNDYRRASLSNSIYSISAVIHANFGKPSCPSVLFLNPLQKGISGDEGCSLLQTGCLCSHPTNMSEHQRKRNNSTL